MPVTSIESVLPSLVDPYLKTTRAKEHLNSLRRELDLFGKSDAYTLSPEDDVENGIYRLKVKHEPIPNGIPLIAGDALYCLRSSLDQLVWSLAKLTRAYPQGTQFPIFETFSKDTLKRFKQYTAGVPPDAIKVIEGLQPYHGPNPAAVRSRLLWRLNILCNIDKHRRISVHSIMAAFKFPDMPKSAVGLITFEQNDAVCVPLGFKSQMRLDPNIPTEVIFGDKAEGVQCNIDGIERIHDFVANNVIPRFARFFK
jgi:hypothetical protein